MKLEQFAPAKVNLGLHVLRRRPDGYHEVETAMVRIGWRDRLLAEEADEWRFTCSDKRLPTDGRNLCVQAAERLRSKFAVSHGAHLHLEKRIPFGAGLGGGSSDAAATLRLLARLWDIDVPQHELMDLAAKIGADVPFFLGRRAMIARGIGTDLTPLQATEMFWAVVCVPGVEISTSDAYNWVTPSADDRPNLPALIAEGDLERWRRELVNDFQQPVAERHPEVGDALADLTDLGAAYVSLSGSGSAVYGLFRDEGEAAQCASNMIATGRQVWHGPLEWEAR